MNGMPGASSFTRRRASTPSKRGIEKSERIACGLDEPRTRLRSSSRSTRSHETSNPPCSSERSASSTSTSESSMNSTWIGILSMGLFLDRLGGGSLLSGDRKREEKHGPFADFPFGPDAPAVPVHDALYGRKPDSGAGVLGRGMQALKRAEKLVGVGHVEARPVVADEKGRAPAILQCTDFDAGFRRPRGELPSVSDEVLEGGTQQMRVALGAHPVPDRDFHRAAGLALLQLTRHLLRDLAQVHRPTLERPARHARQLEQILYQLGHVLRRGAYSRQVALGIAGKVLREIVDQRLAEPVDRAQRRAQVVGHRIGERLELPVGHLQLRGALVHPVLELRVEAQDLALGAAALLGLLRELRVRRLELPGAPIDLRQHVVERVDQRSHLVGAHLHGAAGIIALPDHLAGDLGDREDRPRHDVLHPRGHEQRDQHRGDENDGCDPEVIEDPVEKLVVGAQVHRSEDFSVVHDALEYNQVPVIDVSAVGAGQLRDDFDTTLRATPSRRALILRLPDSDGGGATSKRTLSSTTTKLIMLPSSRPPSDSVTVSKAWPLAAARISGRRPLSARPTKRTCRPAIGSPGRSLRTRTGRPLTLRPATICTSSSASASAPITPIATGLSARAKLPLGHSM